ncbi:hypothetical protein F5880DRAFT_1619045 [Lentinula raphanica]|nr:hypothetical protein F5880DRAFT_1619045 [Lentinula raphanica]
MANTRAAQRARTRSQTRGVTTFTSLSQEEERNKKKTKPRDRKQALAVAQRPSKSTRTRAHEDASSEEDNNDDDYEDEDDIEEEKEQEEEEQEQEHLEVKRTRSKKRKATEDSASRPPRQKNKGKAKVQTKPAATRTSRKPPLLVAQDHSTQHPPPLKRDAAPPMVLQPVKPGPLPLPPLKRTAQPNLVVPRVPASRTVHSSGSSYTQWDDNVLQQGWKILKEYLSGSSTLSTQPLVEAEFAKLFGSDVAMQAPWRAKISQITGLEPDDDEQRQALLHEINTAISQFSREPTPSRIEKRSRSGADENPLMSLNLQQSPDPSIASSPQTTSHNDPTHRIL